MLFRRLGNDIMVSQSVIRNVFVNAYESGEEESTHKIEISLLMRLFHLPRHLSINQMNLKPIHRILNRDALAPAGRLLHLPNLTRGRNRPRRQLEILPTFHDEGRAPKGVLVALGRTIDERLGSVAAVVDRFVRFARVQARDLCAAKVGQELVLALEAGVGVVDMGDADEVYLSRLAGRGGGGWRHVRLASKQASDMCVYYVYV